MEILPSDVHVILLLLTPLTAALLSLLGKVFPRIATSGPPFLVWLLGCAWTLWQTASVAAGGEALRYALGGWPEPFGIVLELNSISWLTSLLAVVLIMIVWTGAYRDSSYGSSFYLIIYLIHFSLQGIMLSRDLFNLFIWFEVLSLCSIVLMAYDRSPRSLLAAFRYLLLSTISIVFYLLGLWILYTRSGSLAFSGIVTYIDSTTAGSQRTIMVALAFVSAGVLTRSALIPFHTWLPPAHSSAPFPVSALLSGLVIKVPLLALWHFFLYLPFFPLLQLFRWLGLMGALAGGLAALLQSDAKRILAYSSVGQMGFIIAAFSAQSHLAVSGLAGAAALFYILMHAASKSLLFMSVGYATHSAGSRNVHFLRGLQRSFPLTALFFWIAALTLMGLPLSGGYYAKVLVSSALYGQGAAWTLTIAGAFTAAALFKLGRIFTGRSSQGPDPISGRVSPGSHPKTAVPKPHPPLLGVGMGFAAILCIALAVFHQELSHLLTHLIAASASAAGSGAGLGGAEFGGTAAGAAAGAQTGSQSGVVLDIDWLSVSSLLKAAGTTLAGFLGLFVLHIESVARTARKITIPLAGGLNRALQLTVIGLLIFVLYSTALWLPPA